MEVWDVYDKKRRKTGKFAIRGDNLQVGDYHLVVFAIIRTLNNKYVISKRAAQKTYAGTWEVTGGSAIAGDSSREAVLREVKEELGIELITEGEIVESFIVDGECSWISDIWIFVEEIDVNKLVCQLEEVSEVKIVDYEEIEKLYLDGLFMPGNRRVFDTLKRINSNWQSSRLNVT